MTRLPRCPVLPRRRENPQIHTDFAKVNGIDAKTDEVGNVVLSKPATPGKEDALTVIMQGHMDMVCESNKKDFDFDNSPITTIIDGEWVHADNTTLGADNGIE